MTVRAAATESAVIIPVPAAEPVVAEHRARFDVAASWGVPAHVTVLYPFVPPDEIDDVVIARLSAVFAARARFDCTFERCAWFGEDVLWLAPRDDRPLRDLIEATVQQFPACPPYGGAFDDVVPHLTVGESSRGTAADLRAAEAEVGHRLPVTGHIDHALLMAGTHQPGSWHPLATLRLG